MHVAVVINASAGSVTPAGNGNGRATSPDEVQRALAEAGVQVDMSVCPPGGLIPALQQLAAGRNGYHAIVVGGGDGTVGCAASVLADTGIPLAVLPVGTLNHFANDLGIPSEMPAWARMIAEARPRHVDLADVNGRVFVNNCSIGAYPDAVRRRNALQRQHGFGKWRAMVMASFEVLRRLRRLHVTLDVDGQTLVRRTPFVLVSNNRYTGQVFSRQLRPRLDEGKLWTYTTRVHRIAPVLGLAWDALTAGIDGVDGLEIHPAEKVALSLAESSTMLATDGEIFKASGPLRFRIRPAALQVLAPPPREA